MLSIEKVTAGPHGTKDKYRIVDVGRERDTIAIVDELTRAGCLLRFLKGSHLHPREYDLAVETMRMIDAKNAKPEGE